MTRKQLSALTVPQLRDRCRAAGLPVYQHRGRRLRKADLVKQLSTPHSPLPTPHSPLLTALSEALVQATIAYELAPDPEVSAALRRVLRGSRAQKDLRVLDRRRRQAISMLADRGADVLRPYWRGLLAAMPAV